mmetsp:Transcript_11296/g.40059  ORF Transcript_11296/g.40059 Transcript_11296/m.40059 type:complete len:206 (-) Transcript_11296:815-1432(-)
MLPRHPTDARESLMLFLCQVPDAQSVTELSVSDTMGWGHLRSRLDRDDRPQWVASHHAGLVRRQVQGCCTVPTSDWREFEVRTYGSALRGAIVKALRPYWNHFPWETQAAEGHHGQASRTKHPMDLLENFLRPCQVLNTQGQRDDIERSVSERQAWITVKIASVDIGRNTIRLQLLPAHADEGNTRCVQCRWQMAVPRSTHIKHP